MAGRGEALEGSPGVFFTLAIDQSHIFWSLHIISQPLAYAEIDAIPEKQTLIL